MFAKHTTENKSEGQQVRFIFTVYNTRHWRVIPLPHSWRRSFPAKLFDTKQVKTA